MLLLALEMGYQFKVSNQMVLAQCTREGPRLSPIITVHGSATHVCHVLHAGDIKHTSLKCVATQKHGKTRKQSGCYEESENNMSKIIF